MGYRSDVILGIKPKYKKEFNKTDIAKQGFFKIVKEDKDMIVYKGNELKWYKSYTDVKEITNVIETDKDNFLIGLGEDGGKHSEWGKWYEYVGIKNEIYIY